MPKNIFTLITFLFTINAMVVAQTLDSIRASRFTTQKFSSYIAPAVFIGYGVVSLSGNNFIRKLDFSTNAELKEDQPLFAVKIDNYLRYAPLVAVYGLDLVGIKAKHNFFDRSASLLLSAAIMGVSIGPIKTATNRMRPNGSNSNSFPSGHTATAFMLAEFLNQEYKDRSIWYSVAGYSLAASTGVFRMYNKAHWVSDVVAGAGFGMLSTKLAYLVYPEIKKIFKGKSDNLSISPVFLDGTKGVGLTYRLGK